MDSKKDAAQEEKQKEIQKKYIDYQMLEQQLKQIQQQLEKLDSQIAEVEAVEQSIADIGKANAGDELLVPISGGVFFRAEVRESKKFLVNVGQGVVVEKDLESAKDLVHSQSIEIAKYKQQLEEQFTAHMIKHTALEADLKKLIEDQQG